jgi:hypothetical protein
MGEEAACALGSRLRAFDSVISIAAANDVLNKTLDPVALSLEVSAARCMLWVTGCA